MKVSNRKLLRQISKRKAQQDGGAIRAEPARNWYCDKCGVSCSTPRCRTCGETKHEP